MLNFLKSFNHHCDTLPIQYDTMKTMEDIKVQFLIDKKVIKKTGWIRFHVNLLQSVKNNRY